VIVNISELMSFAERHQVLSRRNKGIELKEGRMLFVGQGILDNGSVSERKHSEPQARGVQ
jgi:hypothetical protein